MGLAALRQGWPDLKRLPPGPVRHSTRSNVMRTKLPRPFRRYRSTISTSRSSSTGHDSGFSLDWKSEDGIAGFPGTRHDCSSTACSRARFIPCAFGSTLIQSSRSRASIVNGWVRASRSRHLLRKALGALRIHRPGSRRQFLPGVPRRGDDEGEGTLIPTSPSPRNTPESPCRAERIPAPRTRWESGVRNHPADGAVLRVDGPGSRPINPWRTRGVWRSVNRDKPYAQT